MARKLVILGVVVLAVCLVMSTALTGKGGIATYQFPMRPEVFGDPQWGMVTLVGLGPDCPDCPYAYQAVVTVKGLDPAVEYFLGLGGGSPVGQIEETGAYPNNGGNLLIK